MKISNRVKKINFPFPVFITKEGGWFVAECPILDIATQGKTEAEVKEMMKDLIEDYLKDPDTPKEKLKEIIPSSVSYIPVKVPLKFVYGKIATLASK